MLKTIWTILSLVFSFLPKAWPIVKFLFSWAAEKIASKEKVEPIPDKPQVIPGASAELNQGLDETHTQSQILIADAEAPTLVEPSIPEEKKSPLKATGAATYFKSRAFASKMQTLDENFGQQRSFFAASANTGSIIVDPDSNKKNHTYFRTNLRVGSKLL